MTGLVNAHTHLYSGLAPYGLPAPAVAPTNFVEILERIWWRLDLALDADSLAASAELYVAEAVAAGCVGLIDHHESPAFIDGSLDVLADACARFGMPAVLCYGATERNGGRAEAQAGLAECARLARARRPGIAVAVGLHASFTVSDDTIVEAAGLARDLGVVLHVHVAEDGADVADARARGYAGVIDRLTRLGAMIPGSIFAHGVHLTADEVAACAAAGVWLVQNPRSNRGNRVGYPRALADAAKVALGTDGYPAAMADEVAALTEEATAHGDDPRAVAARPAAGAALLAERFGGAVAAPDAAAVARATDALDEVRARARAVAPALWARMNAL
ncbi:MAG: amidohydrolase family protein [Kofleriaceae bacterium]|nr:amidohydrolase family protein [Kofleriaceae bacterium]MBP9167806.1 amidohydrolase family protein [Kofleriaceae bacterium]MBP9862427.1 amidohydrolase family protein [Kofleriaceae bacterium]